MENLRNRVDVELVNNERRAKKLVAAPSFKSFTEINNDLVVVQRTKTILELNRPIYVGFSILDISKTLMYNFHYGHMKPLYGESVKLLFTDTDSLCYEVTTGDIYHDMEQNLSSYDTSDYPTDHHLHSLVNKKVIGKMKDELSGVPAKAFVGLRPKMYCLKSSEGDKKTAKGVKKSVVKKEICFMNYRDALFKHQRGRAHFVKLGSIKHRMHTLKVAKTTLCPLDDKRFILEDGISTLAHGHYKTKT